MNSTKEFETKKQSVNRLQEGLTFDEGEDYNPSAYQGEFGRGQRVGANRSVLERSDRERSASM